MATFLSVRPLLGATDLARARAWWAGLVGLTVAVERPDHLVLRAGEAEVQLDRQREVAPASVLLHVSRVDALYERLQAAGAPILGPLHTHESGRRDFTARAPDGHAVRFVAPTRLGGRLLGAELPVQRPATSLAFWRAAVGFEAALEGDRVALRADGRESATILASSDVPVAWLPRFSVDSLPEAVAEVERHGGRVRVSDERRAIVEDPAGALAILEVVP